MYANSVAKQSLPEVISDCLQTVKKVKFPEVCFKTSNLHTNNRNQSSQFLESFL